MILLNKKISQYLYTLEQQDLLRTKRLVSSDDESMLSFDSNDYLSLKERSDIREAYQEGFKKYPSGSGASIVLSGYHPSLQALEQAFATELEVDDCLLFSSGYAANLAIAALLGRLKAHCLIDKSVHASVYDGLSLSGVAFTRFIHNQMQDLAHQLSLKPIDSIWTEGIFSMSGQIAPLSTITSLGAAHQAALIVDEAHSFGIMGQQGTGAVSHFGLSQEEVPLRMIPFGKTMASQGAVVAGKKEWVQALLQAGRSVVYSTAISPALSHGLLHTLNYVVQAQNRRQWLTELVSVFQGCIQSSSLNWTHSSTPIQQLQLGDPQLALRYVQELQEKGIRCSAIRMPTVTAKATGLRIILNYRHQPEHIHRLFEVLEHIAEDV